MIHPNLPKSALAIACLIASSTVASQAAIMIDGKIGGFAEGYQYRYDVSFSFDSGNDIRTGGELYMAEIGSCLYVGFIAPFQGTDAVNDNTYGANHSSLWNDSNHTFDKLEKSDSWKWEARNGNSLTPDGGDSLDLKFDYLDDGGVVAEVEKASQGGSDVSSAFEVASSLQYNLAQHPDAKPSDSKDKNFVFDFVGAGDWEFGVAYEWKVDNDMIDGTLTRANILANFGNFHMSPTANGDGNDNFPDPDPDSETTSGGVPDGGHTLLLFGLALTGLGAWKKKSKA